MAQLNADPILQKYADLVKANTNQFKAIYFGDPIRIPASSLPALILSRKQTQTSTTTNNEDQHMMVLVFTVVTDIRNTISDEKTLVPGQNDLYNIIEGRDPTTFQLKSDCLLNILRHNIDIDQAHQIWTDISTPTKIDYGFVANKRQEASWSIEGTITAVASLVQQR